MRKNTSVLLGDHYESFIREELESGRYSSASEILRSGLRLLELEKKKIEAINKALIIGEESGKPVEFNNDNFKAEIKEKLKRNA